MPKGCERLHTFFEHTVQCFATIGNVVDDLAGIFFQLQNLMRHVQRRNHQDRQFGNMWDLAGLLIVNLLYLTDQQIRYLPDLSSLGIGLERIRLPEKLYGDKLVQ